MKTSLKVDGMTCVNCARTIEIGLGKKEGVKKVEVSFELGKVNVEYDSSKISQEEIVKTIENLGYRVVEEDRSRREVFIFFFSLISAGVITALMFYQIPYGVYIQFFLSSVVQVLGGWKFYTGAYNSLRNKVAGMDVLVSLGTSGAYIYSILTMIGTLPGSPFFETNVFLITFIRGGRLIEERAKTKATGLLKRLMSAQHSEVVVLEGDKEVKKNVREVFKGEKIVCRTGDVILLDGVIVSGEAYVSEAVITGEPEPILKKAGDRVVSGSVVEDGYIEIEAESSYDSSYLSKINRLIDTALTEKPNIQRLADVVSHYFVQAVVVIASITFFLWIYFTGDLQRAVQFSLAVLVISCPCALGIATPLAVVVGLAQALGKGIIIKKPSSLEVFPKIDIVVFDKTGTLTEGKFSVVKHEILSEDALDVALTLESNSNHPIARAIREFARQQGAKKLPLEGCKEVIGKGVYCGDYFIGEAKDNEDIGFATKVVALKKGEEVIATFYLKDTLRQESKEVVSQIKKMGLKTLLLSGDRTEVAKMVALELGFDNFIAEVSPEEKKNYIKSLQNDGFKVAMVGDGVNDAPALAQADLSFAVSQGVDVAKRAGDVILMSGIKNLPYAFSLGRRVYRKILQNLGWAFVYNVVGIPIAAGIFYKFGIYLKPEIAGLLMALSSVSVVGNTILLQRDKI